MTITARETLSKTRKTFTHAREQLADTVGALVRKVSVLPRVKNTACSVETTGGKAPQVTRRIDQLAKVVRRHQVSTAAAVLTTAVMLLRLFRHNR